MYKLYSFPDQDTPIISNSCAPQFADQHSFPVSMDTHLDHYLRTEVRSCNTQMDFICGIMRVARLEGEAVCVLNLGVLNLLFLSV